MKSFLFMVFLFFVFLFIGQTYSYKLDDDQLKVYMITVSSITTKNIEKIENCSDKIVTIYPDNTYIDIDFFNINTFNNIKYFENYYLKQIEKISTTKYYELKLNGIKVNKVKIITTSQNLKKCYNYLEKVEPL